MPVEIGRRTQLTMMILIIVVLLLYSATLMLGFVDSGGARYWLPLGKGSVAFDIVLIVAGLAIGVVF